MENATDIEIAMYLIRLMDGNIGLVRAQGKGNSQNLYFEMVKTCMKKMTSPFARKLLQDKMSEVKALYNLQAAGQTG